MDHVFFIHSSSDRHFGHFGCFTSWLLWILLQWTWECSDVFEILFSFCLAIYPETGMLDQMVVLFSNFCRTSMLSSTVAAPVHPPTISLPVELSLVLWMISILTSVRCGLVVILICIPRWVMIAITFSSTCWPFVSSWYHESPLSSQAHYNCLQEGLAASCTPFRSILHVTSRAVFPKCQALPAVQWDPSGAPPCPQETVQSSEHGPALPSCSPLSCWFIPLRHLRHGLLVCSSRPGRLQVPSRPCSVSHVSIATPPLPLCPRVPFLHFSASLFSWFVLSFLLVR